ncbi:ankyrin repeat-containing domain protein [Clohesyomyces aquaticus]|uniref:Ankyrin repeat-containing domain protein n=1 Tax=Clohesyomyces aquaticus TaxID=1231657 RepID=A0A1Y1ZJ92_9PLEO|nr:ankyrin repeat-containing domain protein [Clohesyomyces aquaticus]
MSLPSLPHELLLSVCDLLQRFCDINALAQTNKQLYWHLNNYLYALDSHKTRASALVWAAQHGMRPTAWLSLAEGADTEGLYFAIIPRSLGCLGFDSWAAYLTPLQIALCYGSDSVARTLIDRGASPSSLYPSKLCSCTALHLAAALGLTSIMKILMDRGMNVNAQDERLQTPLHYAVTMQHEDSLAQARAVLLLLGNNADRTIEDSQGRRPISIAKKRSSPIVRILSEKGAAVQAYEVSSEDQEIFGMWRIARERREEAKWAEGLKEKQLAIKRIKRERNRKKKRVAPSKRVARARSQEREETARRREAQNMAETYAKDGASQLTAAQEIVEEKVRIKKACLERHDTARETWARMRTEADQRSRMTTRADVQCNHPSGLWKCKVRKTCHSCGISGKWPLLCADCGFVICIRCK